MNVDNLQVQSPRNLQEGDDSIKVYQCNPNQDEVIHGPNVVASFAGAFTLKSPCNKHENCSSALGENDNYRPMEEGDDLANILNAELAGNDVFCVYDIEVFRVTFD